MGLFGKKKETPKKEKSDAEVKLEKENEMYKIAPLQIGDEVPNFTCDSQLGMLTFHDVLDGQFGMLVTFPRDFEATATTELGMIAKLQDEFEARNVKIFALSVDTKLNHRRWMDDVQELQDCTITFPLLTDTDASVSKVFGLVRPDAAEGMEARNVVPAGLVVLVDMDRRVRFISQYPSSTGRNFYEIIRTIDALQVSWKTQAMKCAKWLQT